MIENLLGAQFYNKLEALTEEEITLYLENFKKFISYIENDDSGSDEVVQ
jgi:hypothetical protein